MSRLLFYSSLVLLSLLVGLDISISGVRPCSYGEPDAFVHQAINPPLAASYAPSILGSAIPADIRGLVEILIFHSNGPEYVKRMEKWARLTTNAGLKRTESLSPTERTHLRTILKTGASSKDLMLQSGRAPVTIEVVLKAMNDKLGPLSPADDEDSAREALKILQLAQMPGDFSSARLRKMARLVREAGVTRIRNLTPYERSILHALLEKDASNKELKDQFHTKLQEIKNSLKTICDKLGREPQTIDKARIEEAMELLELAKQVLHSMQIMRESASAIMQNLERTFGVSIAHPRRDILFQMLEGTFLLKKIAINLRLGIDAVSKNWLGLRLQLCAA